MSRGRFDEFPTRQVNPEKFNDNPFPNGVKIGCKFQLPPLSEKIRVSRDKNKKNVVQLNPSELRYKTIQDAFHRTVLSKSSLPESHVLTSKEGKKILRITEEESIFELDAVDLIHTIPWHQIDPESGKKELISYAAHNDYWQKNTILRDHTWKKSQYESVQDTDIRTFAHTTLPKVCATYAQLKNLQSVPAKGTILYRYFSTSTEAFNQYKVQDTITEHAFCSTSLIRKTMFLGHGEGNEYCYQITVGDRTNGRNMYSLFNPQSDKYMYDEKEVLFPPGTRFTINRIEKNDGLTTFHITEDLDNPTDPKFLATSIFLQKMQDSLL